VDLENSDPQLLGSFDTYRLFGQSTPFDDEDNRQEPKPKPIDWRELSTRSLEALKQSKDFRLLAHFAAAQLRVSGRGGYFETLDVAAAWIKDYWKQVYPRVEDDAIMRMNALNCLADRMAIADCFRRIPILEHRQLGRITLRDVDLAEGKRPPGDGESASEAEARIAGIFAASELDVLQALETEFGRAIDALRAIDTAMRDSGGLAVSPDFKPLVDDDDKHLGVLVRTARLLRQQLKARTPELVPSAEDALAEGAAGDASAGAPGGAGGGPRGPLRSRQDALVALDAVAAFFRQHEPSSPVPLLIERAKRLIGKNFLEVLSDLAPEGVPTARAAGGLKDE
jgi:type VI secretion system protein ImpA